MEVCREWKRVDVARVQSELTGEIKMVVLAVLRDIWRRVSRIEEVPGQPAVCSLAVLDC